jgi:hypothetical protein
MRVSMQREVRKIGEYCLAVLVVDLALRRVSTDYLCNLDID